MGNSEAKHRASPITPSSDDSVSSPLMQFANSARPDDPPNPEPSSGSGTKQEQAAEEDDYPRRSGVLECFYYLMNCEFFFNHPPKPSGWPTPVGEKLEQELAAAEPEYPRRPGEPDCAYHVKFGSCKYGMNCMFNHPPKPSGWPAPAGEKHEEELAAAEPEYPRRPDCTYYVKFGSCKYGMNCKFNHPPKTSRWPAPAGEKQQEPEEAAAEPEYPRRPGEPDCSYYVKFGSCKYGMNCKFNHPLRKLVAKGSGSVGGGTKSSNGNEASSSEYKQGVASQFQRKTFIKKDMLESKQLGNSRFEPVQRVRYTKDELLELREDGPPSQAAIQLGKMGMDICPTAVDSFCYRRLFIRWENMPMVCKIPFFSKRSFIAIESDPGRLVLTYQTWKALMESEDGLGWDPKKSTISASPEWWAEKMEAMPGCGKFRFAPLENVDLLNIMFEDMLDSSSTAPEANLGVNTTTGSEQGSGDANDIDITDKDVNEQSEEATLQKSSNKEPYSTKPKRNYVHAAFNHLVDFDENMSPGNSATSMTIDRVGGNVSEIMELVVDAGAEEGSDEHFIATQLFIRPEYREMFLTLKTPQGRLGWLKRMCQVKE